MSFHILPAEVSRSDGGGHCRDCSPSSPKRRVWETRPTLTRPPPANGGHAKQLVYQISPGMPSMRDFVVIIVCHCECTTVRVAIFILSKTYGIASVVSLTRKGITTQSRMPGHARSVVGFLNPPRRTCVASSLPPRYHLCFRNGIKSTPDYQPRPCLPAWDAKNRLLFPKNYYLSESR